MCNINDVLIINNVILLLLMCDIMYMCVIWY